MADPVPVGQALAEALRHEVNVLKQSIVQILKIQQAQIDRGQYLAARDTGQQLIDRLKGR